MVQLSWPFSRIRASLVSGSMNTDIKKRVAVVGAGPMGLATAYELVKRGHQVEVFEAGPVVGGMAASFDFDGLSIERYYHFHCTSDEPFFELLRELGLEDKLCWTATKMGYYYEGRVKEWGNPIGLLKFSGLSFIEKIRYGMLAFLSTKRSDWSKLDKIDAVSWIKSWIGEHAYDVLWKGLFELKFHEYTPNLSAAWIWTRIRRIGNSRQSMFTEKLGYMEGGSEVLMNALKDKILEAGGRVHVLAAVSKIEIKNGAVTGVWVNDEFQAFERVISTVPTPYVPAMIPDLPGDIINQLKSINNIAVVCVIVKLKKALTENFWLNVRDDNMDVPGIIEYSNLNPNTQGDHIIYVPYYVPGDNPIYHDDDEVFFDKIRGYLKTINSELVDEDFLAMKASRYRYAQPICEPEFQKKLPPVDLPIKGLFAADTSYYYPEDRGISESVDFGRKMAILLD
jgi:protoporphyrinogen oxidase